MFCVYPPLNRMLHAFPNQTKYTLLESKVASIPTYNLKIGQLRTFTPTKLRVPLMSINPVDISGVPRSKTRRSAHPVPPRHRKAHEPASFSSFNSSCTRRGTALDDIDHVYSYQWENDPVFFNSKASLAKTRTMPRFLC